MEDSHWLIIMGVAFLGGFILAKILSREVAIQYQYDSAGRLTQIIPIPVPTR